MRVKLIRIKQMAEKIMLGQFPRHLGTQDMLAECVSRARNLATVSAINSCPDTNFFFEEAEKLDSLAFSEAARTRSRKQMRCSESLAPAYRKLFNLETR